MAEDLGAPSFTLSLGGAPLTDDTLRYVQSIELEESSDEIDMLTVRVLVPENTAERTKLDGILKLGVPFTASLNYGTSSVRQVMGDIVERSFELAGGSRLVTLRGFDALFKLKQKRASRHWNAPLTTIATTIAREHGLTAVATGLATTPIHAFQNNETNASFLKRLAQRYDCQLHASEGAVNLTVQSAPPTPATVTPASLVAFEITQCLNDIPTSVVVRGWDMKTNMAVTGVSTPALSTVSGGMTGPALVEKLLGINVLEVDNSDLTTTLACKAFAQSLLQDKAFQLVQGSVVITGQPGLLSGKTVKINGIGKQSGAYLIRATCHTLDPAKGYRTRLEICSDSLCATDAV